MKSISKIFLISNLQNEYAEIINKLNYKEKKLIDLEKKLKDIIIDNSEKIECLEIEKN